MSFETPLEPDDQFAALLGGVDEALARGQMPPEMLTADGPELADRLARGRRCVELLSRLRPRRRTLAAQDTPRGGDTAPASGTQPLAVLLPTTLGRFEVRQELGRGGFGIVYLAHDPLLKRDVALKVPRFSALADPDLKQRFSREAQVGAGLDHPNVAAVYDAGEVAGVSYIASAYCPGITLAQWLRQQDRPIAFAQAAALIACLAGAVQHGHSRGILHRDLKPSNVMLVETAQDGEPAGGAPLHCCRLDEAWYGPKITDFGLARRIDEQGLTREGATLGTPGYMAPEQAQSGAEHSTAATDVYGLGAILYELLVGRAPFIGESPLEILDQVCHQEVVPPSRLRPRLPRDLETICLKCLAKNPQHRYGSAALLAADLRRFLAGEPILARPVGRTERAVRWCRRNPAVAALLGGIALLLVCGTAISTTLAVWAINEKSRAAESARLARDSAAQERAARELADYRFGQAEKAVEEYLDGIENDERLTQGEFFNLRLQLLASAVPFYEEFVRQKPGDAKLEAKRGRAYGRLGSLRRIRDHEQAIADYQQALAIFRKLAAAFPEAAEYRQEQAKMHSRLCGRLIELGKLKEAETEIRQALALMQAVTDAFPADPSYRTDLSEMHNNLGAVLSRLGNDADATQHYREAIELKQALVAQFPTAAKYRHFLAISYQNLGLIFSGQGKYSEAAAEYRQAISLQRSAATENPHVDIYRHRLAQSHHSLGSALAKLGKWTEAEEEHHEALRIQQQVVDEVPGVPFYRELLASIRNSLAIGLVRTGKPEEAKTEYRLVLKIRARLVEQFPDFIEYRSDLGESLYELAMLLAKDGELDEARRMNGLAIEHQLRAYQAIPTNQQYARRLRNHYYVAADAALKQKDHAAAAEAANQMAQVRPDVADDPYSAARYLGRCVKMATQDSALPESERQALAESYADQAVEQLSEAVRRGFTDVKRLQQPADFVPLRARPDFKELVETLRHVKGALEGEELQVLRVTAGTATTQAMARFTTGQWSGEKQLYWYGAKPGARLDVAIDVSAAGTYDLEIVLTKARDYGVTQLWLDEVKLGDPVDLYHAQGVVTTGVLKHGGQSLAPGPHVLSLEIVGANPAAAKQFMIGLDYVRLVFLTSTKQPFNYQ